MKIEVPATIMATTKIHMQLRNILMMFPEAFACILCHHASCFRCPASSIQPKNSHFYRTPHPNQLLFKLDFSLDNFSFFSAPIFCSLCLSHSLFALGRTFLQHFIFPSTILSSFVCLIFILLCHVHYTPFNFYN